MACRTWRAARPAGASQPRYPGCPWSTAATAARRPDASASCTSGCPSAPPGPASRICWMDNWFVAHNARLHPQAADRALGPLRSSRPALRVQSPASHGPAGHLRFGAAMPVRYSGEAHSTIPAPQPACRGSNRRAAKAPPVTRALMRSMGASSTSNHQPLRNYCASIAQSRKAYRAQSPGGRHAWLATGRIARGRPARPAPARPPLRGCALGVVASGPPRSRPVCG